MNRFKALFLIFIFKLKLKLKLRGSYGQLVCVLVLIFSVGCSSGGNSPYSQGVVKPFYGGVAGDEPRAVLAARKILALGGTAADAATAMYFALAVTLPSAASLGGGGSCLVFRPKAGTYDQRVEALDFLSRPPTATPITSASSSVVPGNPLGVYALHSRYGSIPWGELVAIGEKMARFGIEISKVLGMNLKQGAKILYEDQESRKIFGDSKGGFFDVGDILYQTDLARTLSLLRTKGAIEFYRGKFAEKLVSSFKSAGVALPLSGLRNYKPRWVNPGWLYISKSFWKKDRLYFVPHSASAGVQQGQILGLLERQRFAGRGEQAKYHLLAKTALLAKIYREKLIRQNMSTSPDVSSMVSDSVLDQLSLNNHYPSSALSPSFVKGTGGIDNSSETSFVIIDKLGMAIACVFTLNNKFGIGKVAPDTGIIIAAPFAKKSRSPIFISPMMILNTYSNQFILAAAASGGTNGAMVIPSVIARAYLGKEPLNAAISAPRIYYSRNTNRTLYEPALAPSIVKYLDKKGHKVAVAKNNSVVNIAHCPKGLPLEPDECHVLNDPRGEGLAIEAQGEEK